MSDKRTIVIIGGVAGGASAAARARRMNETATIIMLEKDEHVSFANCGLPYYVGGEIKDREKLLVAKPEKFRDWFNIDVRPRNEATTIDRPRKAVTVKSHETGEEYELAYDKLILAPGASPIVPPIDGIRSTNVLTLRNVADVDRIKDYIDDKQPRRAAVIGAGYIGLEMVEMLHGLGMDVALIEKMPQVMPPLDSEMAHMVQVELEKHEVQLHLNNGLAGFETDGEVATAVTLEDGTQVEADLIILGIGVKPNTQLADAADLAMGETRGIVINEYAQTSDPDIYAAGDAVEYAFGPTGTNMRIALAGPANRAGRTAGEHAAADAAPALAPVNGTAIVRVFDLTAGMTGLSEKMADRFGIDHASVIVPAKHHVGYYPGAQEMFVKLIYAPNTGKVLGTQIVGGAGVDKRIDVISTAISFGSTVEQLTGLDLAYAPPYGAAKDPVHMAAFVAQNALRNVDRYVPPTATNNGAGVQWLDVRNPDEWQAGHIDGAVWVPLHALRDRLDELDRNRPVVTICRGGQRSYYASRVLRQNGFADVATLTGGMAMQSHV